MDLIQVFLKEWNSFACLVSIYTSYVSDSLVDWLGFLDSSNTNACMQPYSVEKYLLLSKQGFKLCECGTIVWRIEIILDLSIEVLSCLVLDLILQPYFFYIICTGPSTWRYVLLLDFEIISKNPKWSLLLNASNLSCSKLMHM